MLKLSIIIINYRTPELTMACVHSVHNALADWPESYEVIIVDNGSGDGSAKALTCLEDERTHLYISERNGGFGYGNNLGSSKARGEYLFFLNSDTLLLPDVLPEMVAYMQANQHSAGTMTCQMVDGEDHLLVTGHAFENAVTLVKQVLIKPLLPQWLYHLTRKQVALSSRSDVAEADWVSGAGLLIPRKLFYAIGGWNEQFFLYMEDEELCRCVKQHGYKNLVFPRIGIRHLVGKSGGSLTSISERYKSSVLYFSITKEKHSKLIRRLLLLSARRSIKQSAVNVDIHKTMKELRDYHVDAHATLHRHNSFIQ